MDWFADAFAFLVKGGPVMVPLIACSIISVAVMIERFVKLRAATVDTCKLSCQLEDLLYNGEADKAVAECVSSNTPVGAVLAAGIEGRRQGIEAIKRAMEERAIRETGSLSVRLGILDTIITIAPLLGLLGTVTGMIRSFHVISSKEGIGTPTAITGGVAEALIATATGLAIAIVTLIGYNYLNEQVKSAVECIEIRATHLQSVLSDIEERRNEIKSLSA